MKITKKTARCTIYVEGCSMTCPLCNARVESGENHTCSEEVVEETTVRIRGKNEEPRAK